MVVSQLSPQGQAGPAPRDGPPPDDGMHAAEGRGMHHRRILLVQGANSPFPVCADEAASRRCAMSRASLIVYRPTHPLPARDIVTCRVPLGLRRRTCVLARGVRHRWVLRADPGCRILRRAGAFSHLIATGPKQQLAPVGPPQINQSIHQSTSSAPDLNQILRSLAHRISPFFHACLSLWHQARKACVTAAVPSVISVV
jgi:hypothetical protein